MTGGLTKEFHARSTICRSRFDSRSDAVARGAVSELRCAST